MKSLLSSSWTLFVLFFKLFHSTLSLSLSLSHSSPLIHYILSIPKWLLYYSTNLQQMYVVLENILWKIIFYNIVLFALNNESSGFNFCWKFCTTTIHFSKFYMAFLNDANNNDDDDDDCEEWRDDIDDSWKIKEKVFLYAIYFYFNQRDDVLL